MIEPTRRGLLIGVGALIAAPAIVRASSLMPVKPLPRYTWTEVKMGYQIERDTIERNGLILMTRPASQEWIDAMARLREEKERIYANILNEASTFELADGRDVLTGSS